MSIIKRFSYVVPNLVIYLYNKNKSVYIIRRIDILRIATIVSLIYKPILNLVTIVYSSKANVDLVTLLYLVELQYNIFPLISINKSPFLVLTTKTIIQLICKLKSLFCTNLVSIKTKHFISLSNSLYLRPLVALFLYYSNIRFSKSILVFFSSVVYVV